MIEAEENKEYLPIEGLADFRKATLQLLLGSGHPAVKEVINDLQPEQSLANEMLPKLHLADLQSCILCYYLPIVNSSHMNTKLICEQMAHLDLSQTLSLQPAC